MKVASVSIQDVRGIRNLNLSPNRENLVVWGPNGSGKSAVVDALDFLLTGRISRLTGEGTGGISLASHGPHVDSGVESARVSAQVSLGDGEQIFTIARCMASPKELECPKEKLAQLSPVIETAERGHHVLSRRELLRFIAAESKSRAAGIQELLRLTAIEDVRKILVRARNDARKAKELAGNALGKAKEVVCSTAEIDSFTAQGLLSVVNRHRKTLDAAAINALASSKLKTGLTNPLGTHGTDSINASLLGKDIEALLEIEEAADVRLEEQELRKLVEGIRENQDALTAAERAKLIQDGLPLVAESGECPLCGLEWPAGELVSHLEAELASAQKASQQIERIEELTTALSGAIDNPLGRIERLEKALTEAPVKNAGNSIWEWGKRLRELKDDLEAALKRYPNSKFDEDQVAALLAPQSIAEDLGKLQDKLRAEYPEATPEQTAWDTLTRLEENLLALEHRESELDLAELCANRGEVLHDCFVESRDEVLNALYKVISDRFSEFYKELHGADEVAFEATLRPEGAGIKFEVDFYGRGVQPPLAMHSEGHQDSMGLCLYLALAEYLSMDKLGLTILDDVVMSVDMDHRRAVCRLFAKHFPDRQFVITTHDRAWANQLRTEGIARRGNVVEFYKWDIDTGPYVNLEADLWSRIDAFLKDNEVASAAHLLRRGSEQFFSIVCEALEAPVRYSSDGRNNMGEFVSAAIGRYKRLLDKARKVAQSWGRKEEVEYFIELASTFNQIVAGSQVEQWAVNPSVHYTDWAEFSPSDFAPVRDAFQDLQGAFVCQSEDCGSILRVEKQGPEATAVRCKCGAVNWNLVKR